MRDTLQSIRRTQPSNKSKLNAPPGGDKLRQALVALQIKSLQRAAEPVKLDFSMNTVAECITYCRKKVAERVVPCTGGHRALEIVIEG
jgi:hypothetical protein